LRVWNRDTHRGSAEDVSGKGGQERRCALLPVHQPT